MSQSTMGLDWDKKGKIGNALGERTAFLFLSTIKNPSKEWLVMAEMLRFVHHLPTTHSHTIVPLTSSLSSFLFNDNLLCFCRTQKDFRRELSSFLKSGSIREGSGFMNSSFNYRVVSDLLFTCGTTAQANRSMSQSQREEGGTDGFS